MAILSMQDIQRHRVPAGAMTLWWLGQAGFIIKSPGGKIVALDPYLSNSCKALGEEVGFDMDRLVPPPMTPEDLVGIDLYVMTHSHQDHLDPDTLEPYRAAGGVGPFLAPAETAEMLRKSGVPDEQRVLIWPNKCFTIGDLTLRATFAIPFAADDLTHVGYLISADGGPTFYFTGDTGFHELLATNVCPHRPEVMVTVINGAFNNLSSAEAAHLTQQIDPKVVIPCHYDLFPDNVQPPHMFRTNLHILGISDRYRLVEHGQAFTFPKSVT